MKKTIKLLGLGAMAVAMLTGCTAEEPGTGTGREITVSFSVSTDAQLTRDGSSTTKSNRLRWTVFNADGTKVLNSGVVKNAFQTATQSVDINLIEGSEYTVAFWADNDAYQCYTYDDDDGTIKIDYSKMTASSEACDAFYGKVTVPANGIVATGVTLSRPFAQFNYAALDYGTYKKFGGAEIKTPTFTFKNSGVSTELSMFSGRGSNVQPATIAAGSLPQEAFTVGSQDYKYLYYAYVLPSEAVATVEFRANAGDAAPYRTYDNVPLKENMRTNIFGNVLTSTTNFQISLDLGYAEPWDGETATTPVIDEATQTVLINKPSDFAGLADLVNGTGTRAEVIEPMDFEGYTVYLNKDLDLGGKEWTPIGNGSRDGSSYTGHVFKGNFNGQGHTITGLKISKSPTTEKADLGFFGVVDGGTIENINFVNVDVNLAKCKTMGVCVGQLTGGGTVKNITVSGKIKGQNGVGGVVGRVTKWGNVIDCTNYADITAIAGSSNTGGIIGAAYYNDINNDMTITGCKNYGTITTAGGQIGGIVGLSAAFISNCSNYGNITAVTGSIGGIAGDVYCSGWIKNCTNEGNITNNGSGYGTGGIAGWIRYYQTEANYPRLNIVEVDGCVNEGAINGGNDGGGIVGTVYHYGKVINNKNYAPTISAITFAAGIVGNIQFPDKDYRNVVDTFTVKISDNLSTTSIDNITVGGSCKHLFAYNNAPKDPYVVMENNSDTEL